MSIRQVSCHTYWLWCTVSLLWIRSAITRSDHVLDDFLALDSGLLMIHKCSRRYNIAIYTRLWCQHLEIESSKLIKQEQSWWDSFLKTLDKLWWYVQTSSASMEGKEVFGQGIVIHVSLQLSHMILKLSLTNCYLLPIIIYLHWRWRFQPLPNS